MSVMSVMAMGSNSRQIEVRNVKESFPNHDTDDRHTDRARTATARHAGAGRCAGAIGPRDETGDQATGDTGATEDYG